MLLYEIDENEISKLYGLREIAYDLCYKDTNEQYVYFLIGDVINEIINNLKLHQDVTL